MKFDFKNRKIQIAAGAVLALIVFAGICITGGRLEALVESIASRSLHTEVKISSIGVSLRDKAVTVKGIKIKNPEGFKTLNAVEIKKIKIAAENMTGDTITFNEVSVEGMEVTYEAGGGKTNLGELQKALKRPGHTDRAAPAEQASEKDLVVKKLVITGGKLTPALSAGGRDVAAPVALPDITMTDLGGRNREVSPARALNLVLSEIIATAARTVTKEKLFSAGGAAAEKATGAFKNLVGK